jgi:hypothetical protein
MAERPDVEAVQGGARHCTEWGEARSLPSSNHTPKIFIRYVTFTWVGHSHQLHDRTDGPRDVDAVVTIDGDDTGGTAQGREPDKGGIIVHDRYNVVCTVRDEPIQLSWLKYSVLRS